MSTLHFYYLFVPLFVLCYSQDYRVEKIIKIIDNSSLKITNDLKKHQIFNLRKLIEIKCYSGLRRIKGLPVRGQRTHTNAKTAKKFRK